MAPRLIAGEPAEKIKQSSSLPMVEGILQEHGDGRINLGKQLDLQNCFYLHFHDVWHVAHMNPWSTRVGGTGGQVRGRSQKASFNLVLQR